MTYSSMVHASV